MLLTSENPYLYAISPALWRAGDEGIGGDGEVGAPVVVEAGGDGIENVMSRCAAPSDDDDFGEFPRFVKADAVGPRRMAVVLNYIHGMPTKVIHVRDHVTFKVVFAGAFRLSCHIRGYLAALGLSGAQIATGGGNGGEGAAPEIP
jgi:hypothetical protein